MAVKQHINANKMSHTKFSFLSFFVFFVLMQYFSLYLEAVLKYWNSLVMQPLISRIVAI